MLSLLQVFLREPSRPSRPSRPSPIQSDAERAMTIDPMTIIAMPIQLPMLGFSRRKIIARMTAIARLRRSIGVADETFES